MFNRNKIGPEEDPYYPYSHYYRVARGVNKKFVGGFRSVCRGRIGVAQDHLVIMKKFLKHETHNKTPDFYIIDGDI